MHVRAGSATQLRADGRLLTKIGSLPVLVVWHDGRAFAIEDRCPHLGFPLRQGSVEEGLLTCHWHHARFDLTSGCTLDPWADDAQAFDVRIDGDDVVVTSRPVSDPRAALERRLQDGLEQNLTLVLAKATLGLLDGGADPDVIVGAGVRFGATYRRDGWGAGLTVLTCMANLLPHLHESDRSLALVHGLARVAADCAGHPPRFPETPMAGADVSADRLAAWYRRMIDTRNGSGAERALATAVSGLPLPDVEAMMTAAITDHVFIDEGHTLDFTNKAFEALERLGPDAAGLVLTSLVHQTASADRAEESSAWRHPVDLVALAEQTLADWPQAVETGDARFGDDATEALGRTLLADDPAAVTGALIDAARRGASDEHLARAVAYAAALRLVRFHVQNDPGDWDEVHHAFTTANALHRSVVRRPGTEHLRRAIVQCALRVYLDRFLNVPVARSPRDEPAALDDLHRCWDTQGEVDRAGQIVFGALRHGGASRGDVIAALGHALLEEDPGFHWFQVVEAGAAQAMAWPEAAPAPALILTGVARFLAAHTPTRRERPAVVRIAARLRRGEALYEG